MCLFAYVTKYSKNEQTDVSVRQQSVSPWEQGEGRTHTHTHTHTLKLLHFKSVLTVCSVAWRARFNVEPLAVSTADNLRSVLLNQKKIRQDNSKRKTRGTLCSNGNTIQIK